MLRKHFGTLLDVFIYWLDLPSAWIFFFNFFFARMFFLGIFPCMNFFLFFFSHPSHHFSNGPSLSSAARSGSQVENICEIRFVQVPRRSAKNCSLKFSFNSINTQKKLVFWLEKSLWSRPLFLFYSIGFHILWVCSFVILYVRKLRFD